MKFKELAWGAFVIRHVDDDKTYQRLASNNAFLERLRTSPTLLDFESLRDFLVSFHVHYAPKDLAQRYLRIWPRLQPHVQRLSAECLETCKFDDSQIQGEIKSAYKIIHSGWGGDTVISKVLHFFNISLFVMYDADIKLKYGKGGAQGYVDFLQVMQREANEALNDFKELGLSGRLEEYLSQKLGYKTARPLTKLIDDFNWVTVTRKWPESIPEWLLNLWVPSQR
jgi:hypothetical protein